MLVGWFTELAGWGLIVGLCLSFAPQVCCCCGVGEGDFDFFFFFFFLMGVFFLFFFFFFLFFLSFFLSFINQFPPSLSQQIFRILYKKDSTGVSLLTLWIVSLSALSSVMCANMVEWQLFTCCFDSVCLFFGFFLFCFLFFVFCFVLFVLFVFCFLFCFVLFLFFFLLSVHCLNTSPKFQYHYIIPPPSLTPPPPFSNPLPRLSSNATTTSSPTTKS